MGNPIQRRSITTVVLLGLFLSPCLQSQDKKTKILFIGNSYTGQIRNTVTKLFKASPEGNTIQLEFITPGGKNLEFHHQTEKTLQKIKEGDWDFVVLQDQSQTPAIFPKKFDTAAGKLDKIIDASGAKTVFYQTWGRRDGDKMNRQLFPTYEKMQKALSDEYQKTAKRCDALLAPVGDTWSRVRKADSELGTDLYKKDGSHPSDKGAYLAACVFYTTLFNKSPATVDYKGSLSADERKTILSAIELPPQPSPFPITRTLTNTGGTKIEVTIIGRSKTQLHFESNGKSHSYDLEQLSEADQNYIKTLPVNR